jgi:glyoxylase-like metal-dependent hydrolase (beta-lactamase superfamily II)
MHRLLVPLGILVVPLLVNGQDNVMQITTRQLQPGLHVFSGFANGNVLALETREGLVLVDGQTTKRVGSLDSALRAVTTAPVRWVINTHYHEDHTQGNAFFRERGARVLAHVRVPVHASRDTTITELEWHRTPLPSGAMPTVTFSTSRQLMVGGEEIVVRHPGAAHTDGDALIWLPRRNVLHIGDILEVGAPPFVDWWAGGTLDGMLRAIDDVLTWTNDSTKIVPGHGPVSTRADLRQYRNMLDTVQRRARAGIAARQADEQLVPDLVRGYEPALGGERRARQFAGQVLLGLRRPRGA